jgi:hypothetical protein
MKKVKMVFFAAIIALLSLNHLNLKSSAKDINDLATLFLTANASSEIGCISRTNENNGDCTTDGVLYFCENSWMFHDCVKGVYP